MDIKSILASVMEQAKEKGFGTKPEDVVVSEKIALVHSEISEAYDAFAKDNIKGKHGFQEEIGDIFQRSLHLAGIFEIDLPDRSSFDLGIISGSEIGDKTSILHKITSDAYEGYRKKDIACFKANIAYIIFAAEQISLDYDFPLDKIVYSKIKDNKKRDWKNRSLNEKFAQI